MRFLTLFFVSFLFCVFVGLGFTIPLFNNTHLERLGEKFTLSGEEVKGYWVYAEERGGRYVPVTAVNEGDFCVDDVARVVLLYSEAFEHYRDTKYLELAKEASKFVLKMHAGDGEFFNFAYKDGTINRFGITSYKSTSWWTLRAFWGLSKLAQFWFDGELDETLKRTFSALRKSPPKYGDQLSLYLLGLTEYYKYSKRSDVKTEIHRVADELLKFRWTGFSKLRSFFSAYRDRFSWNGWGNHYLEALVEAYKITGDGNLLKVSVELAREQASIMIATGLIYHIGSFIKLHPELAYSLECLVVGMQKLYELTNDEIYAHLTALAGSWLFGGNRLGVRMYGPNGEGYDGLEFAHVNRNAGAESTICALRSVLYLEKLPRDFLELSLSAKIVGRSGLKVFEAESLDPGVSQISLVSGDYGGGLIVSVVGRSRFKLEKREIPAQRYYVLVSGEFNRTMVTVSSKNSLRKEVSGRGLFEVGVLDYEDFASVSFSDSCRFDQLILLPVKVGVSYRFKDHETTLYYDLESSELVVIDGLLFQDKEHVAGHEYTVSGKQTGDFFTLDLRALFNNDGFANPRKPGNFDNLGGVIGAYFPSDEVSEGIQVIHGIPFLITVEGFDNIRCDEQRLVFPVPLIAKRLYLLVAANHGDYVVKLNVSGVEFEVTVTDWCRPPFDLKFGYRYIASGERQYIECGLKVVEIPFEGEVLEIVLPREINVHVFGITLLVQ
ncbi:hypothetical protein [Fervidobacterium thailandense]|uniref:hypothetical protein n=1 Tax=Fervidobacterium thailandense TaxID=1008305 RepID=UPI000ABD28C1|nr:hypothetical protein [Fervidobacterium thailandense]